MDKKEEAEPDLRSLLSQEQVRRPRFVLWGIAAGTGYWLLESVLHAFVFSPSYSLVQTLLGEHDPNELFMRLLIVALLVAFGYIAAFYQKRLYALLTHTQKLNRLLAFLSDVNQVMGHKQDMQTLFDSACRIAAHRGGFHAAWIGLLNPETGMVEPRAWFDMDEKTLDKMSAPTNESNAGCSIVSRAIRRRQPCICNDIAGSPCASFCRDELVRHGARAAAAFPLIRDDDVAGAFTVYARDADYFQADVVAVLEEAAGDISFALEAIERNRTLRERVEELERFRRATMQREFRIKELRSENAALKKELRHLRQTTGHT